MLLPLPALAQSGNHNTIATTSALYRANLWADIVHRRMLFTIVCRRSTPELIATLIRITGSATGLRHEGKGDETMLRKAMLKPRPFHRQKA